MLRKPAGSRVRRGSILILVVALLGVLFVAGLGFLAVTSNDRRSAIANRTNTSIVVETDGALQNVVAALSASLWDSNGGFCTGAGGNPAWTYPCSNTGANFGINDNAWLASTFPVGGVWPHISNLTGQANFGVINKPDTNVAPNTLDADADGDGTLDSRWTLSASGRYRMAYRVVDLCGMINLNTAGRGFLDDMGATTYNIDMMAGSLDNGGVANALNMLFECSNPYCYGDQSLCGRGTLGYNGSYCAGDGYLPRNWSDSTMTYSYVDLSSYLDNKYLRTGNGTFAGFPDATPFRLSDDLALHSYGTAIGPVSTRFERCWPTTFSTTHNQMPASIASLTPAASDSLRMYYTTYNWTRDVLSIPPPTTLGCPAAGAITTWQQWADLINAYYGLPAGNQVLPPVNVNGLGDGTLANDRGRVNPHNQLYTRALMAAIVLSGAMTDADTTKLTQQQAEQLVVNIVNFRDGSGNVAQTATNDGYLPTSTFVDTVFSTAGSVTKVYGVTRQVFITSLGAVIGPYNYYPPISPTMSKYSAYALTLFNPYADSVDISGWQVFTPGGTVTIPPSTTVAPSGHYTICNQATRLNISATVGSTTWNTNANDTDINLNFGADYLTNGISGYPVSVLTYMPNISSANADIYLVRPIKSGSANMVVVDRVRYDQANSFGIRKPQLGTAFGNNAGNLAPWLAMPAAGKNPPVFSWTLARGEREWLQERDDIYKCSTQIAGLYQTQAKYVCPWLWNPSSTASATMDYNSTAPIAASGYVSPRDGRQLPIVAGIWGNRVGSAGFNGLAPTWLAGQSYLPGQVVTDPAGGQYQCLIAHQSVGSDTPLGQAHATASYPSIYYWKAFTSATNPYGKFDTLGQLHWLFLTGPQAFPAGAYPASAATSPAPLTYQISYQYPGWPNTPTGGATGINAATTVNRLCVDFTNSANANPVRADYKILKNFCCNERSMTGIDHNGDGVTINYAQNPWWDMPEWRVAGKININTAPPYVLEALSYYVSPACTYGNQYAQASSKATTYGLSYPVAIYNNGLGGPPATAGFKKGIGQVGSLVFSDATNASCANVMSTLNSFSGAPSSGVFSGVSFVNSLGAQGSCFDNASNHRAELKFFDTDYSESGFNSSNDINPAPPSALTNSNVSNSWIHPQRGWYDHNERHYILDRLTDVMTTRSDTFLVYILVQEIDTSTGVWIAPVGQAQPTILQSRRIVAIIDRSMCNYPPGNANYVSPQVVARSVTTY